MEWVVLLVVGFGGGWAFLQFASIAHELKSLRGEFERSSKAPLFNPSIKTRLIPTDIASRKLRVVHGPYEFKDVPANGDSISLDGVGISQRYRVVSRAFDVLEDRSVLASLFVVREEE